MTLHTKNPTAGGAAGLDKTSSLPSGNDGHSNAPEIARAQAQIERNPRAVAAAIKDLTAEYAVEAAHIAGVYLFHFCDDMAIGDLWSAEHDLHGAVLHLQEAARAYREWQGKSPAPRGGAMRKLRPDDRYDASNPQYPNHAWDKAEHRWIPKKDLEQAKRANGEAARGFEGFEGDQGRGFSENNWPEPNPLPDGLLPVAAFDPAFLPEAIAPWVMDISNRMQCPPDFVAIPAMVALGSVIGRKVAVRPQRKTDWYEVPNLWGCIVGRPGAMKSPAMDEALKPLHRLEAEARKANEAAAKDYEIEVETFELRKEDGQKKGRAALKGGAENISSLLATVEPEEPKARRYVVNDATYEALGVILADNPRA